MKGTLPSVHLAGNCAVDIMVRAQNGWSDSTLQRLAEGPVPLFAGGAGWPAYLLGKIGHRVQLNTKIGRDLFGAFLRDRLAGAGVELVGPEPQSTAVSMLLSAAGGLKSGMVYPGEPIDWLASVVN